MCFIYNIYLFIYLFINAHTSTHIHTHTQKLKIDVRLHVFTGILQKLRHDYHLQVTAVEEYVRL